jgi:hypothetical protein
LPLLEFLFQRKIAEIGQMTEEKSSLHNNGKNTVVTSLKAGSKLEQQ